MFSGHKLITTIGELKNLLQTLTPKRYMAVLHVLRFDQPTPDMPLQTGPVLKVALADWMTYTNALDDDAQILALLNMETKLNEFAQWFEQEEASEAEKPAVSFTVLDGRFVIMSTASEFYDTAKGEFIQQLPHHVLTSVSCDLSVLLLRLLNRMDKVRKLTETGHDDQLAAAGKPE